MPSLDFHDLNLKTGSQNEANITSECHYFCASTFLFSGKSEFGTALFFLGWDLFLESCNFDGAFFWGVWLVDFLGGVAFDYDFCSPIRLLLLEKLILAFLDPS